MTTASIIVCTYNRSELLAATLKSILADPSAVDRELLVVDNASTDATAAAVSAAAATSGGTEVRYLVQPLRGKSNALNLGIREAHGRYLLFTDDDVLVEPGWAVRWSPVSMTSAPVSSEAAPCRSGQSHHRRGWTTPTPARWVSVTSATTPMRSSPRRHRCQPRHPRRSPR